MGEKNFGKNKIDKKVTWFGFTLTQQQAVILFTLALIGILIIPMILFNQISSVIWYFTYISTYNGSSLFQMILISISGIITMCIFFVISLYTIIRTRKLRDIS